MQLLARWMGMIILVLGVIGLIFGVMLIVFGSATPGAVMDELEKEQFPEISRDGTTLILDPTNIIDTTADVDEGREALTDARREAGVPADLTGTVKVNIRTPQGDVPLLSQLDVMVAENTFNGALAAFGLASILTLIGIPMILMGLALIFAGFMLHRMMAGMIQMAAGLGLSP